MARCTVCVFRVSIQRCSPSEVRGAEIEHSKGRVLPRTSRLNPIPASDQAMRRSAKSGDLSSSSRDGKRQHAGSPSSRPVLLGRGFIFWMRNDQRNRNRGGRSELILKLRAIRVGEIGSWGKKDQRRIDRIRMIVWFFRRICFRSILDLGAVRMCGKRGTETGW